MTDIDVYIFVGLSPLPKSVLTLPIIVPILIIDKSIFSIA